LGAKFWDAWAVSKRIGRGEDGRKNTRRKQTRVIKVLSKAEEFFGLDATRPIDAALLLRILADAVFSTETRGRPPGSQKWNRERLYWLGLHRSMVEHGQPGIKDAAAAAKIMARYKQQYKDTTREMIRQRLPQARRVVEYNVRFWPKADVSLTPPNVRFRGKADIAIGGVFSFRAF
jgi:hypothetical protein